MSLLQLLSSGEVWNRFYEYKTSLACQGRFTGELRKFIDERRFDDVAKRIEAGEPFPLPKKSVLTKLGSEKSRSDHSGTRGYYIREHTQPEIEHLHNPEVF